MVRRAARLLLFALALSGCPPPPGGEDGGVGPVDSGCPAGSMAGAGGCVAVGWQDCSGGFERQPSGSGCLDVQPSEPCPPGTMPQLGFRECQPIGWTACPARFAPDLSGWGCREVLPQEACSGATREALGQTQCVPVGDCSAPFPPPSATHFVDDSYAAGQLDATHFKTIGAAIQAAPAGAVIAVEEGLYPEGIWVTRPVTIVGRCAQRVRLDGAGLSVPGVYSVGTQDVRASGLTLAGHFQGVRVQAGGSVAVEDVVIESPRLSGLISWQSGSELSASRVVVREARQSGGQFGWGANADEGGRLTLDECVFARGDEAGIVVTAAPGIVSEAVVRRSVVRDTNAGALSLAGAGLVVFGGGRLEARESAVLSTRRVGLLASDEGSVAVVTDSVLRGGLMDSSGELAAGVSAHDGASVELLRVAVRANQQAGVHSIGGSVKVADSVIEGNLPQPDGTFGMGVALQQGASAELSGTALVRNTYYGVLVTDPWTTARIERSLVAETRTDGSGALGRGVNVEDGARAVLSESALVGNHDESLYIRGEQGGSRSEVSASALIVRDGRPRTDGLSGVGIGLSRGGLLELHGGAIVGAREAAVVLNDLLGGSGSLSEAHLSRVVIRDTQPAADGRGGAGIACGGKLVLSSSLVARSHEFGVLVANAGSSLVMRDSVVMDTLPAADGLYGHGVVGIGPTSLALERSEVAGNEIGLAFDRAGGVVRGSLIRANQVGLHAQGGVLLRTGPAPAQPPPPGEVVIDDDVQLVDNQSRTGLGQVPLPSDPIPPHGN